MPEKAVIVGIKRLQVVLQEQNIFLHLSLGGLEVDDLYPAQLCLSSVEYMH